MRVKKTRWCGGAGGAGSCRQRPQPALEPHQTVLITKLAFLCRHGEGGFWCFLLVQGSKLEVPLWLANGLHDSKRRIIAVELPKMYKEAWRTVFSADTNVVDLHKMGPYYYGLGSQLLNFDNPKNPEIAHTGLQTFVSHFRRIVDSSQNTYNEDTSVLVARLDELERTLFRAGQKGLNDFQCWEKGQASQITASSLVQNYGKRKFADTDG
ncbi:DNA replication complex GINS protein PSF3 [Opisthocomus hoazin]|uniref:DNA replication complex GINS protein PSF3 n=1 Tax=Opisthocomus hoazin TaxID=30419 RepID=UPI003F533E54